MPLKKVPVGRADRRDRRESDVREVFEESETSAALDLLELTELAWHDVYDEISPSEQIVDDMLVVSQGNLEGLVLAARLAVADWRDLRLAADEIREGQ